jgi:hypothetical protein
MNRLLFDIDNISEVLNYYDQIKVFRTDASDIIIIDDPGQEYEEDFNNSTGFSFDTDRIEFVGGNLQQKAVDTPGQNFTEDFADDTDFTYDSDKAEFAGGLVRQKDQREAVDNFYVPFTSDMDATRYGGNPIGTAQNGAIITAGELDLSAANAYAIWDAANNCDSAQQGTIEFYFRPNYNSSPLAQSYIFTVFHNGDNRNLINLYHLAGGAIQLQCYNSAGFLEINTSLGVWNPTAGQRYRISFNYDFTNGATRLFIDGVQQGSTQIDTFTRDSGDIDNIILGANRAGTFGIDGLFDDLQCFDSVQHTVNYTPSIPAEYAFLGSSVILPEMEHIGTGITSFDSFVVTGAGTPRFILNGQYWTGSAWASSDNSYAQASTESDINANISTLTVAGLTLNISVVFTDDQVQSTVNEISVGYTSFSYLESTVILPDMNYSGVGSVQSFDAFASDENREAHYILNNQYYNGSQWVASNGLLTQSNTLTEVQDNIDTLESSDALRIKMIIEANNVQFIISELTVEYTGQTNPPPGADGYNEITDSETRIAIIPERTQYYFVDDSGDETHYYKTAYYNSVTQAQSNTSDPIQGSVEPGKLGYTFGNYTPPPGEWGEVLTPDDIRYTYMFGIDAIANDQNETEFTDDQFRYFVESAVADFEAFLTIDIKKRVYVTSPDDELVQSVDWREGVDYTNEEDPYPFIPEHWKEYGFIQLRHCPVLSVERAIMYSPVKGEILDLMEWIRYRKAVGQLNFYPKQGSGYGPYNIYGMPWHLQGRQYPEGFEIDYSTGFKTSDFVPKNLRNVIGMWATIKALDTIGDGLLAGFSSQSVSLDGLSESFSSTQSATSAYFGARIKSYIDQIQDYLKRNRYKWGAIPISFVGVN